MPCFSHRILSLYVILFLLPCGVFAEESRPGSNHVVVSDGTPVRLQLAQTISSAQARSGDRLDFEVVEDVTAGDVTVIRAGTIARGYVVKVDGRRLLGMGGELVIKLESVKLVTGDRVRLRARCEFKGNSHTKLMATEMFVAGLIYLPAAPAFLLTHGHTCSVLKSTEVTAYIDGNFPVESADLTKANQIHSRLNEMLTYLPPRALDGDGREGDMINLVFIAKEQDVQRVFARAGWVEVDKFKLATCWHLLWQRKHYVKLPMNTLYVFGRRQDYAYAMPDPAAIVARRHHLRIWKTDYEMNGAPIWVGAATYDVAIQIEMRKFQIIHRIDPDVDAEREFIARNLTDIHLVTQVKYLSSVAPVFRAQTARGEPYHSDSRILLLDFTSSQTPGLEGIEAVNHPLERPHRSRSK